MNAPRTFALVCGDRNWDDDYIIGIFIHGIRAWHGTDLHLYHGAAPGADSMAGEATKLTNGWVVHSFPADWDRHGKKAGPIRNKQMLDAMMTRVQITDIAFCIAFKDELSENLHTGGTEDMIKRCMKANLPVYHLERL